MSVDILRMKNSGDKPWSDQHAGVKYALGPGDTTIIPWDAFCLWFGNPELVNRPTLAQYDRDAELHRIRTRLGFVVNDAEGKPSENPPISFETLEGKAVLSLLEDPEGERSPVMAGAGNYANLTSAEAVAGELEALKNQQKVLLEQLQELTNAKNGSPTLEDVPEDVPTKVKVSQT